MKDLVHLLRVCFRHIYREANMAADFLTKEGSKGRIADFFCDNLVQGRFWGLVRIDKLGLSFIQH